jgi:hypothetical protein
MVEPRKPEEKVQATEHVTEAELAEFEQLLSARFETDPSAPKTESQRKEEHDRQQRLKELSAKITGKPASH